MEIKIIESNYGDEWWFGGDEGMEIQVEDVDGSMWVTGGCELKDSPLELEKARRQAELIKQALEVHHETRLTPRQLAEQRAELLGALKDAKEKLKWFVESYPHDLVQSEKEFFAKIDDALESCK